VVDRPPVPRDAVGESNDSVASKHQH
jgi:hypothetical protein